MFVDVRVFDPNCKTYKDMEPPLVYKKHENAKKVEYNDRVINVERGTFTPSFSLQQEDGVKNVHSFTVI